MAERNGVLVVTTDAIDGVHCKPLGLVLATCCYSKSLGGDLVANVKNWSVGGELSTYSRLLARTAQEVLARIQQQAAELGADAVVGFRITSSDVAQGAAELIGYGTAARFEHTFSPGDRRRDSN